MAALAALVMLTSGCAPARSTIRPWSDDTEEAKALRADALAWCAERRSDTDLVISPFTTDGCTMFPDGEWVECCVAHDMQHWCGGSAADRLRSDRELRECVTDKGFSASGRVMYWGTRIGAHPWLPAPWRWGYGWKWPGGYEETGNSSGGSSGVPAN